MVHNTSFLKAFVGSYFILYFDLKPFTDGRRWKFIQNLFIWKYFIDYLKGKVNVEEKLDNNKQYIFAAFPHGVSSINHFLTMTNGCNFLSNVYNGDRRDLVATVLLMIPILRDILLWLGCVDASAKTAKHNLKMKRSLLIYIGGEKEQLLAQPNTHKIYLKSRKGFIKLAIQHNVSIIPMYAFGENEAFQTIEEGGFWDKMQNYIQKEFKVVLPLFWGRYGLPIPFNNTPVQVELGKPIYPVLPDSSKLPLEEQIERLHQVFIKEMERLFERTKKDHGIDAKTKLIIY